MAGRADRRGQRHSLLRAPRRPRANALSRRLRQPAAGRGQRRDHVRDDRARSHAPAIPIVVRADTQRTWLRVGHARIITRRKRGTRGNRGARGIQSAGAHDITVTGDDRGQQPRHRDTRDGRDSANRSRDAASPARPLPLAVLDTYQRATMAIERMLPLLVTLWIAGLCFCSIRLLGGLAVVARVKRRYTAPAPPEWQQRLSALAHRMRVRGRDAISLHVCTNIRTAAVIGWLRPVILVPASALAGLAPHQMEAVLAHELAHIRRHDYLVNLLQSVVETLFFYHPAVWYLSRRVRLERENCCDDDAVVVVGDPVAYAGALTDLEMLRQNAPALAMAANGGSLLRRVERLLAPRSEAAPSWSTATGLLTLAVVFAVIATAHGSIAAGLQPESTGAISVASAIDNDGQWPTPPPPPAAPMRRADEYPYVVPPPPAPPEPPIADIDTDVVPPAVPLAPGRPRLAGDRAAFRPFRRYRRRSPMGSVTAWRAGAFRHHQHPWRRKPRRSRTAARTRDDARAAGPTRTRCDARAASPACIRCDAGATGPRALGAMPAPPAPRALGAMPAPPAPRAFGAMPVPEAPPAPAAPPVWSDQPAPPEPPSPGRGSKTGEAIRGASANGRAAPPVTGPGRRRRSRHHHQRHQPRPRPNHLRRPRLRLLPRERAASNAR